MTTQKTADAGGSIRAGDRLRRARDERAVRTYIGGLQAAASGAAGRKRRTVVKVVKTTSRTGFKQPATKLPTKRPDLRA